MMKIFALTVLMHNCRYIVFKNGVGSGAIIISKEVDGTGNLTNQWALKRQTDGSFDIGYGTGANPGVVGSVIRLCPMEMLESVLQHQLLNWI
ncbi:MAG: hypothetical protein IPI78_14965 [Chitinophagaceae bacterium]|nr:hypothetical protein [Chitinophagaceae bacterium]